MTELESSKLPLGRAYPLIIDAIERFGRWRTETEHRTSSDDEVVQIYRDAIECVRRYTLDSTHNLLQLAYVLTPAGHKVARLQLRQPQGFSTQIQIEDVIHLDDFVAQLADHGDGETDETSDDDPDVEILTEEEDTRDAPEAEQPAVENDNLTLSIHETSECTNLVARARCGLERIAEQFRLEREERACLFQCFDVDIADSQRSLGLSESLDHERFRWEVIPAIHPTAALFAEIALRFEPLVCSEAASERTIGQQRRHLSPHRMRTGIDLLLARSQMEDGHQTRAQTAATYGPCVRLV
jgi:hypothetical protein